MIPDPQTTAIKILVVLGPTASGKTTLAVQLARKFRGEILSADSRQVYQGLNLGAGKDLSVYQTGGETVNYHLIDIADPAGEFSVFHFQKACFKALAEIHERQHLPILAGGTGLYLEAVLKGYWLPEVPENVSLRQSLSRQTDAALQDYLRQLKPDLHNTTDLTERARMLRAIEIAVYQQSHALQPLPELNPLILGIRWDRSQLRPRIAGRLRQRLEQGMIEEVEQLHQQGLSWERLYRLGLEYRYIADFLQGKISNRESLFEKLYLAITHFAKRQEAWFRRMERQGTKIHWFESHPADQAERIVQNWLEV